MATIEDVLKQYETLRAYCDGFWERVRERHGNVMSCRKGCHDCCRLESVSAIEAYILLAGCRDLGISGGSTVTATASDFCPFLQAHECLVYSIRPLICRTHGLAITGKKLTGGAVDCCPLNFTRESLAFLDRELVLDVDMITANLMRLNLAFCLLLGDQDLAGKRIGLGEIIGAGFKPDDRRTEERFFRGAFFIR